MGKGDKRSRRGKITAGSYGNSRLHKSGRSRSSESRSNQKSSK